MAKVERDTEREERITIEADEETQQAILFEMAKPNADWHYWLSQGYEFG